MLQDARFRRLLWECLVKEAAGTGTALDVCLPPTFRRPLSQEKNLDYFILLPEQSGIFFLCFRVGSGILFLSNKAIRHSAVLSSHCKCQHLLQDSTELLKENSSFQIVPGHSMLLWP